MRLTFGKAVSQTSRSSPGSDGLPYVAWRRLADLGVDVLFNAASALASDDGEKALLRNFPQDAAGLVALNATVLVFTPPKAARADDQGTAYFLAEDLRRFSIISGHLHQAGC